MPGTSAGALKAVQTIKAKNPDFYRTIGSKGGKNGNTGGFYDRELASRAGKLGGSISRRGKSKRDE